MPQQGPEYPFVKLIVASNQLSHLPGCIAVPSGELTERNHLSDRPNGATTEVVMVYTFAMLLVFLLQSLQILVLFLGE